jgi:hypothetical protein
LPDPKADFLHQRFLVKDAGDAPKRRGHLPVEPVQGAEEGFPRVCYVGNHPPRCQSDPTGNP